MRGAFVAGLGGVFLFVVPFIAPPAGFAAHGHIAQINEADLFADLRSGRYFRFGSGGGFFGWGFCSSLRRFCFFRLGGRFFLGRLWLRFRFGCNDQHGAALDRFSFFGFFGGGFRFGFGGGEFLGDFLFQIFAGDFIERAGRHPGIGDAESIGLGQHFFALDTQFLGDVVNAYGHKWL